MAVIPVQEHHARKGKQDAMRAKLFAKLAREITVAAKIGQADPLQPAAAPRIQAPGREHAQDKSSAPSKRQERRREL